MSQPYQFSINFTVTFTGEPDVVAQEEAALREILASPLWQRTIREHLDKNGLVPVAIDRITVWSGSVELVAVFTIAATALNLLADIDGTISMVERIIESDLAERLQRFSQRAGSHLLYTLKKTRQSLTSIKPPSKKLVPTIVSITTIIVFAIVALFLLVKIVSPDAVELTNVPEIDSQAEGITLSFHCDWLDDWELQPNGEYLWVGNQPGTVGCPKIGQEGELFTRMMNHERLTLVVDVGETPLPIAICFYDDVEITAGTFLESTGYIGTCYDDKVTSEENFPKVSGKVRITGSTGFAIGYTTLPNTDSNSSSGLNCKFIEDSLNNGDIDIIEWIDTPLNSGQWSGVQTRVISSLHIPEGWVVQEGGLPDRYGPLYLQTDTIASIYSPYSCRPLERIP